MVSSYCHCLKYPSLSSLLLLLLSSLLNVASSRIYDFCLGQLASRLTCALCGAQTRAFDPFTMVSLPVPAATAIASASTSAAPGSYAGKVASSSSLSPPGAVGVGAAGGNAVVRGLFFPLAQKKLKKYPGNQGQGGRGDKGWIMEESGAVAFAAPLGANPTAGNQKPIMHRLSISERNPRSKI